MGKSLHPSGDGHFFSPLKTIIIKCCIRLSLQLIVDGGKTHPSGDGHFLSLSKTIIIKCCIRLSLQLIVDGEKNILLEMVMFSAL